jgi:hypothetical protein
MFNSHKPRAKFNYRRAIQYTIYEYDRRNRSEDRGDSFDRELEQIKRQLRARFVAENPEMPDADIDTKVTIALNAGRTRCKETLMPARGVPKEIQDQRRAERRKKVKANKHSRR